MANSVRVLQKSFLNHTMRNYMHAILMIWIQMQWEGFSRMQNQNR